MITVNASAAVTINGVSRKECEALADYDPIRQAEIISIRRFLEARRGLLTGRILDFGAGKPGTCRAPEPYRDLCEGPDAEYFPFDRGDVLPPGPWDVVLCTQVLQYVSDPGAVLDLFGRWLHPRQGTLILTYPTNWAECENTDLWRFTKAGVERMLSRAHFQVVAHVRRAEVQVGAFHFPLGYGVVAGAL